MSVVLILLPLALLLALGFLVAYVWAVKHDQYAEGDTPAIRILLDESTSQSKQP